MEITLVKAVNGDEVHGTDNDKKTGCGINLQKAENVVMYRKCGVMQDLKEITCERCKTVLAKKIIKSDKKEMSRLIKEEKARAKKGIEDEKIVPLGNTAAKITRSPEEIRAEEKRIAEEKKAAEEKAAAEKKAAEERIEAERRSAEERAEAERRAAVPKTIPGTGVAMDDDLAAFAINVPKEEESKPAVDTQDDFLAQFAIEKPQEEAEEVKTAVSEVQDDFLAQFAIPSPVQEEAPAPSAAAEPVIEDISAPEEMSDVFSADAEAPSNEYAPVQSSGYYEPETVSAPEDISAEDNADEDIMKMFSIGGDSSTGVEVLSETEPVEASVYDNDDAVIDVHEHEIAQDDTYYGSNDSVNEDASEEISTETSEWDYVANQLFGFSGVEMPELNAEETAPEPEEAPVIEDIAAPEPEEEPVIEDITASEPEETPVIEDMAASEPEETPVIEDMAASEPEEEPVIEDIAAPEPEETPVIEDMAAPEPEEVPAVENIAAQEAAEEINSIGDVDVNKYRYSAPVFADEKAEQKPAVPEQTPPPAPVQPDMTAPIQPTAPVQPAVAAPVQNITPEQPSVITVPQFAGYDMNGQPVYNYVQMQMTGYDMNGQPIFTPIQPPAPVQPAMTAPMQPTAPVQPTVAAPVQPTAPVQPAVTAPMQQTTPYKTPTANISKIATNPHSKPIPKSFVNALANSREQGKKNLIETQGMSKMPVLDSIDDVLSQMGDEGVAKRKKENQNVPVFEEYKAPTRSYSSSGSASAGKSAEPERILSKAELKAKKKQDKIDAKFKKDLAKRGF